MSATSKFKVSRYPIILSHFSPPRRRQNFLRRKLLDDHKVRLHLTSQIPKLDLAPNEKVSLEDDSSQTVFDDEVEASAVVERMDERVLGASVMRNRLDNWVEQFKIDAECWGIGSSPIFIVYQDSDGDVERVVVNEDEIVKRSRAIEGNYDGSASEVLNSKILSAKSIAREMEKGNRLIPRNSSVAKVIISDPGSAFVSSVRNLKIGSNLLPKAFGLGGILLTGVAVLWVIKLLCTSGKKEVQYTQLEKELMRRKMKSREKRAASMKGGLQICEDDLNTLVAITERPKPDRNEVINSVRLAKSLNVPVQYTSPGIDDTSGPDNKIKEIREMARKARQSECGGQSLIGGGSNSEKHALAQSLGGGELGIEASSGKINMVKSFEEVQINLESEQNPPVEETQVTPSDGPKTDDVGSRGEVMPDANGCVQPSTRVYTGFPSHVQDVKDVMSHIDLTDRGDAVLSLDSFDNKLNKENHSRRKAKVIRTVREAKEYLSSKHGRSAAHAEAHIFPSVESEINLKQQTCGIYEISPTEGIAGDNNPSKIGSSQETSNFMLDVDTDEGKISGCSEHISDPYSDMESLDEELQGNDLRRVHIGQRAASKGSSEEAALSTKSENWLEKYSGEMKPIIEKMGDGFRKSYMDAREKAKELVNFASNPTKLQIDVGDSDLEWMKDEKLREIVFQVRDNELAGRDPFYSMEAEDRRAFFEGLEKKVEKENKKLSNLHEYLHSNIENLDYGADGISIYDPLETIVPRWKEPPVFTYPKFLTKLGKKPFIEGEDETMVSAPKSIKVKGKQSTSSQGHENVASSLSVSNLQNTCTKDIKKEKIVIEGSDGSIRRGKKSGREYWQHTKKWSRGFLDSYSAETDPEIKSIMKDIGKDLDRWITEKEIQEAAEIRDKVLERNKQYVEKKLDKLRREIELFGPQAVACKYREYGEEEEQDYLWWLDLPYVLCIELYLVGDGEQKVGFYSLEMAADLELEPKPYHVIAFEDPADCKNFCYIIQAHMETQQNGLAFVVPRPSKDAFREAKANGFGVTIIRKGELKLNVDQTLEEVEEQITEIGSKIYHDKIMKEHALDTTKLMKGVFGVTSEPKKSREKSKRTRKRITKK